jgi:hypothetical protein
MFLDAGGNPFPAIQPYIVQSVAYSTAVSSSAFNKNTTLIEIIPSSNCWVAIGASPQTAVKESTTKAAAGGFYIAAGTSKFYCVQPGWVISVVQDSASGMLSVIEAQ